MKTRSYLILLILWLFLLSGCFSSYETIRDIRELKQDHSFYLGRMTPDSLMLDPAEQKRIDQNYNTIIFLPGIRRSLPIAWQISLGNLKNIVRTGAMGKMAENIPENG